MSTRSTRRKKTARTRKAAKPAEAAKLRKAAKAAKAGGPTKTKAPKRAPATPRAGTTIAVLATLDTKGEEARFLREQLAELGSKALLVDLGVLGEPVTTADVTREQVAEAG